MRTILALFLVAALGSASAAQTHVSDKLPPLDKSATRKLLKDAERELAMFAATQRFIPNLKVRPEIAQMMSSNPNLLIVDGISATNELFELLPNVTEYKASPLNNRIIELRCKYVATTLADDAIPKEHSDTQFVPTDPVNPDHGIVGDQYIIHATTRNHFSSQLYPFELSFPDITGSRKELNTLRRLYYRELKKLTHRVLLRLPYGWRPPKGLGKGLKKQFNAQLRVTNTEWDRSLMIPTFTLHAEVIRSEDLGLNIVGKSTPDAP